MLSNTRMLGANSRQLMTMSTCRWRRTGCLQSAQCRRRRLRRHSPAPRLPLSGEAARFAHLGLTIGNAQRFSPVAFTRINLKGARSCWGGYRGRWVYLIAPRAGRLAFSALTLAPPDLPKRPSSSPALADAEARARP